MCSPLYVLLGLYNDRNWFHDDLSTLEFLRETSNNVLLDFKSSYFRVKEKLCTIINATKKMVIVDPAVE